MVCFHGCTSSSRGERFTRGKSLRSPCAAIRHNATTNSSAANQIIEISRTSMSLELLFARFRSIPRLPIRLYPESDAHTLDYMPDGADQTDG
jgi:hypothetical protein